MSEYLSQTSERSMEMHAVPQHQIFDLLVRHRFAPVEVLFDGKCGPIGYSHTFLARKETDAA